MQDNFWVGETNGLTLSNCNLDALRYDERIFAIEMNIGTTGFSSCFLHVEALTLLFFSLFFRQNQALALRWNRCIDLIDSNEISQHLI